VSGLVDRFGRPARSVNVTTPHVVIEDLPPWCGGVLYSADEDVLTLRAQVPASEYAHEHLVHFEMTPQAAGALMNALSQCLARAEQAAKLIDVDPMPAAGDD